LERILHESQGLPVNTTFSIPKTENLNLQVCQVGDLILIQE